jgi:hypothetical protein
MTPKQWVRAAHPTAFCESNGADFQIVVVGPYGKAIVLGMSGRHRRAAWAAAAAKRGLHRCAKCDWQGTHAELLDGEACPNCKLVL